MTITITISDYFRKLYFSITPAQAEDLICCKPMQSIAKKETTAKTKFEKNPFRF